VYIKVCIQKLKRVYNKQTQAGTVIIFSRLY